MAWRKGLSQRKGSSYYKKEIEEKMKQAKNCLNGSAPLSLRLVQQPHVNRTLVNYVTPFPFPLPVAQHKEVRGKVSSF